MTSYVGHTYEILKNQYTIRWTTHSLRKKPLQVVWLDTWHSLTFGLQIDITKNVHCFILLIL